MTQNLHPLLQRAETNGIHFEMKGAVAMVRLSRPSKRNALNDGLIEALRDVFQNLPEEAKSAVVYGEGDHFCAGLDLSELKERDAGQGVHHSRSWHVALDAVQLGRVPVIAALHGAVVGGGLELASACHIRVADDSTFFALPEGTRGIFVGGGGSVRIPKLIGVARMTDMMLTGRVYNAVDRHDVDWPCLQRSRWRAHWFGPVPRTNRNIFGKGFGPGTTHCHQRTFNQLRIDACPAPHCRATCRSRLPDRSPDLFHCTSSARSQSARQGFLGRQGCQSSKELISHFQSQKQIHRHPLLRAKHERT
ncbi:MAG: 2,3-dehydroadipyl-CoA hydratase [Pseudomonadota bacterium]